MFRRKEENEKDTLFNTTTEGQGGNMSGDSITSTAQPSAVGALSNTTAAVSTSSAAPSSNTAANPARPATDTRANPAPGASTFRPSTSPMSSMGVDVTRTRMPETKVMAPSSATGVGIDKANKTGRRVLTVGNDILLKGEIATCDRLVIEGKVDATLNDVHTVEIAETGSFKGSANIEDAEISGLFEGDLVVRNRLVIYATGKVRGKISYGEIEIERGGELTGEIKTTTPQSTSTGPRPSRTKIDDKVAA